MQSRFRLFAGPNGSGKTYLFDYLKQNGYIHTEIYVNADKIEHDIKHKSRFSFNAYRVKVSDMEFKKYILQSGLFQSKIKDKGIIEKMYIRSGVLQILLKPDEINSYHASFIASYLCEKLLNTKQSFCFETVMSHISKVQLLKLAKEKGYKTYLYFIFTDNVEVNIARVKLRTKMGLHDVDASTIKSRYDRTFKLLPKALVNVDEAYIIDNSSDIDIIAEKHRKKLQIVPTAKDFIKKFIQPGINKK